MSKLFFAYPNNPSQIGVEIEAAIKQYNASLDRILSWTAMDIIGAFIPQEIFTQISNRTFVADISRLNPNVIFEIGYAIGQKRDILLVKNSSIEEGAPTLQDLGIFDTLGFIEYQNSIELLRILKDNKSNRPYKNPIKKNLSSPVYILETQYKGDFSTRIIGRIKKSNLHFRSFDPNEMPRLAGPEAITRVAESYGVVIQLLGKEVKNSIIHNLRASFLAGLARGMEIPCAILQQGSEPVPIDYRDFVHTFNKITDIDDIIADFVKDVMVSMQELSPVLKQGNISHLESLVLGASAAENEMKTLQNYYLRTDAYLKASRGEVQLVIGRKGAGKSAIFLQIRDKERASRKNLVLDLIPEGYKLIKFKERVLDFLEEGTFLHTIMAFWEYLLLLEVAHKILHNDKTRHLSDPKLLQPYKDLEAAYKLEDYLRTGDFSERMSSLMDKLDANFKKKYGNNESVRLSVPEVTGLIHETNIRQLKTSLVAYLKNRDRIWILFDNIDKGWPASGLTHEDLIIIRALIDASKRVQRFFEKSKIDLYTIIFLRSDVYNLLVEETSDRQKEAMESIDWTDPDLLARLIELRIQSNTEERFENFTALWRSICVSHYKGEDSFQFLLERSLMRPRFLINFIGHCRSFAINLNHTIIQEEDITKGLKSYSDDLLKDVSLEIRDIFPECDDLLSAFALSESQMSRQLLESTIIEHINKPDILEKIIDILLWYGFLGVKVDMEETKYMYNVNYNILLLKAIVRKKADSVVYMINPGFWPSLLIMDNAFS